MVDLARSFQEWQMTSALKVLITGGSGFISSAISARLSELKIEHAILDLLEPQHSSGNVPFYKADVQDKAAVSEIIKAFQPTHVIHNAAANSTRFEQRDNSKPALIGSSLVEAMVEHGVNNLIYASSAAVYGNIPEGEMGKETDELRGLSLYADEKAGFESFLHTIQKKHPQLRTVIFRYANVYGPGQRDGVVPIFTSNILAREPVHVYGRTKQGDKGCLRDFVYVEDVVEANILALTTDMSGTYNVSYQKTTATADLLDLISKAFGRDVTMIAEAPRDLEIKSSSLDSSRLRSLGWLPQTKLVDGIAKIAASKKVLVS